MCTRAQRVQWNYEAQHGQLNIVCEQYIRNPVHSGKWRAMSSFSIDEKGLLCYTRIRRILKRKASIAVVVCGIYYQPQCRCNEVYNRCGKVASLLSPSSSSRFQLLWCIVTVCSSWFKGFFSQSQSWVDGWRRREVLWVNTGCTFEWHMALYEMLPFQLKSQPQAGSPQITRLFLRRDLNDVAFHGFLVIDVPFE